MTQKAGIIAVATPTGRSGIGVIRVSGSQELIRYIWDSVIKIPVVKYRYAYYTPLYDPDGNVIDQGIVLWFQAPNSTQGKMCWNSSFMGIR